MSGLRIPSIRMLRRYRATFSALMIVLTVAIWPSMLFPLARAYVEFSFHHPFTEPLSYHYPPVVVAAMLIWISSIILIALGLSVRQIVGQYRLHQMTRDGWEVGETEWSAIAERAGVAARVTVIGDDLPFAFCAGFFVPVIYVSDGLLSMLDDAEIEAVLRHEASHLRRRDPLRLFLVQLVHTILAPFPIIETLCDRVRIGIELAADQAALTTVPMPALAGAVLKVARASSRHTLPNVAGLTASEARIDALLGKPVQVAFTRRDLIITAMVLLTLVGVVAHLWSIRLCPICPTL